MSFQASDEPKFRGGDDDDDDDVHVTFTTNSEATKLVSYEDSYDEDEDDLPLSVILPQKISCLRKCRDETVKKRPPCNSFHSSVKKSKVKHSVVNDEEEEDDTLTSRGFKKKRKLADKPFSMIEIKNFVKQQLASAEESIEECHRKEKVEQKRLLSLKRNINKYSKELANKKIQVRCVREINRIFKKLLVKIEERSMELVVKEAQLCLMEDLIGEQKLELKKKEVELHQIKLKENEFWRVMENIDKDCERKEEELRVVSFKVVECTEEVRIEEKELDVMKELIGGQAKKLESMKKQYEGQVREHESKVKHFEEQVKELEFREKKLEGGMEELKSKKKVFEGLVKDFESKEREFQGQKEELKSEKMCFESRVKEFESKEKQLDGRMKDFESKKGEFEGKVKEYESKEEEFEGRKREFKSEKMQFESRMKELESKENELGGRIKDSESKKWEFEGQVNDFESQKKNLESQVKELESKENQLEGRIKEFESKKGEFEGQVNDHESQKKNLESQVKDLESKENQLEGRIKEFELKNGEFEDQVNDLESQKKNLESQVKELESKENQLEGRIKEFEVKNGELEGQVNDLESQKKNLESRVKELESKNKYFESRVKELESKEREFEKRVRELKSDEQQLQGRVMELKPKNRHSESRAENFKIKEKKFEGWEKPLIKEEESGDQLSPIIEENSLQLVLVPNETESFGNDILNNLLASPDPSEVVLEIIQNPIVPRCREGHNTVTIESGHIALLVQLMRISPHIKPHVREEAMKLALDLKAHMSENFQAVLGFLLILSIYGLLPSFNKAEVLKLFGFVAQHKIAVELFETLGFADKISDFIQNLIRQEQHIAAVRFICAYDMINKYQPFNLLREHMQNVKLISESSCKNTNSIEIKDKARDEEIASLKTVLDCISDNNLQSEHLLKEIQFRSFELFEQKGK